MAAMDDRDRGGDGANGPAAAPRLPDFHFIFDSELSMNELGEPGSSIEPDVGLSCPCERDEPGADSKAGDSLITCKPRAQMTRDGRRAGAVGMLTGAPSPGAIPPPFQTACKTFPKSLAAPTTPTAPAVRRPLRPPPDRSGHFLSGPSGPSFPP